MKKLGTILEEAGVIDEIQLVRALSHQRKWRCRLGRSLVELGFVTEEKIAKAVANQLGMTYREFDPKQTPAELFDLIPKSKAAEKLVFPVGYSGMAGGKTVLIAMADPTDKDALKELELASGCRLEPLVGKDSAIEEAINGWERFKESNPRSNPADMISSAHNEVAQPPVIDMNIDTAGMESANVIDEQWPGEEEAIEEIPAAPVEEDAPYVPPSTETMPLTEEDIPDPAVHIENLTPPEKPVEMEDMLSVSGLPPIDDEEGLPQEIPEIEHSEAWEQAMPDQMPQIDQNAGVEIDVDLPEVSHAEPWESIMPGVDAAKENDEAVEQPEEQPDEQEPAGIESDNSPPPAPESSPAWPGMEESNSALPPEWDDANSKTQPAPPPIIKPTPPPPLPPFLKAEPPPLPKTPPPPPPPVIKAAPPPPIVKAEPPPLPKAPPPPPLIKATPPPLPPVVKAELPPLPKTPAPPPVIKATPPPPPPVVKAEPPPLPKAPSPPPLIKAAPPPLPPPVVKVEPPPITKPEPLPAKEPELPRPVDTASEKPKSEHAKAEATTMEYIVEEISDLKMQLTLLRKEIKILKEALSKVMRGS